MNGTFPCPVCDKGIPRPMDPHQVACVCPHCDAVVTVPPPEEGAESPVRMVPPPPLPFGLATEIPGSANEVATASTLRMVGIFNIIVGAIFFIAALLYGFTVLAMMSAPQEAVNAAIRSSEGMAFTMQTLILFYAVPGVLSLLFGFIPLIGGIKLVKRSPDAYGWGMAAAIVSVIALWVCCAYLLTLPSGIYTFVVLANPAVKRMLGRE